MLSSHKDVPHVLLLQQDTSRNKLFGSLPQQIFRIANFILPWEFRPHHQRFYGGLNFGDLEFNWEAHPEPTATARVFDVDGNARLEYTFSSRYYFENDAVPRTPCRPIREEVASLVFARRAIFVGVAGLVLVTIPITCMLALCIVFVVFMRSYRFMREQQSQLFDAQYQKID